jgi:hypothetical protein
MNEPNELDPMQLEQATSRTPAPLDGETAALHEGWLALGRAIDAENAGFREDTLLARLAEPRIDAPSSPLVIRPASSVAGYWMPLVAAALALAMLFAVVRTLSFGSREEVAVTNPDRETHPPEVAVPEIAAEPAAIAAWSDPLDDEIDTALTQLRSASSRTGGVDASLTSLQNQMQQFSADLAADSL